MSRLMTKWHVHPAKTQISLGIRRLIRVFAVCIKKAWVLSYPLSTQQSLWSDWADAQADLSLRWAHMVLSWGGSNKMSLFTSDHLSLRLTKPTKWPMRPVWSESSLYAKWVANCKDPMLLHVDNEDFDQDMSFCWFCRVQAHLCWWHFKEPWLIIFNAEKWEIFQNLELLSWSWSLFV